jgi:hypothetical protein
MAAKPRRSSYSKRQTLPVIARGSRFQRINALVRRDDEPARPVEDT